MSADIFLGTSVRFFSLLQTKYTLSQLMVIFGVSGRLVVVSCVWERSSVVTSCIPCVSYSLAKEVLLKQSVTDWVVSNCVVFSRMSIKHNNKVMWHVAKKLDKYSLWPVVFDSAWYWI